MTAQNIYLKLFKSGDLLDKAREWPPKVGVALIKDGARRLAVHFFHDDEDATTAVKRICILASLKVEAVELVPHLPGFKRAVLPVAVEHGLLAEASDLAKNHEHTIEEAADFAINYEFAMDTGADLVKILKN